LVRRNQLPGRATNKHRIYRDHTCITALEDFLERATRGSGHR
jgi:hypothetical protein